MEQRRVTKLKVAVIKSGLEQREIAARVGVSDASMSRYVRGSFEPRAAIAARIAEELGTTVGELWPTEERAAA